MKFSQWLAILNCYIGQEKSQLDFISDIVEIIDKYQDEQTERGS